MKVITRLSDIPKIENLVLTIGTFDGVHQGHVQIINKIIEKARKFNGSSGMITFDPHPRMILDPRPSEQKHKLRLLTTINERGARLESLGLDYLFIVPFSVDFANQPARDYVEQFLVEKFNPNTIVIGYDHRFGRNRKGDVALLKEVGQTHGFQVDQIDEHTISDLKLSSTQIRTFLRAGNIEEANRLLGYNYSVEGYVVHGDKRGTKIGFPTANIEIESDEKLIPCNGVYAVTVKVMNKEHQAMLNIGTRPTFDGKRKTIEAHLLNFDNNIYGERLVITFARFLRKEKMFESVDDLVRQLKRDKTIVNEYFN